MPKPVVVALLGKRYPKFAKSVPAIAAIRAPPVVVLSIDPAVMVEMAKFVVVACASVVFPVTFSVPPTAALPAASIVVDALEPNDAVFPVTRPAYAFVAVAFVVVSPPANERSVVVELPTNGYPNVAEVKQMPFTDRHPPVIFKPFANVLVAVVDATFRVETERPPRKVEVAFVEVANNDETTGVDVPVILVPSKERSDELESVVLFVPPLPTPNVPVTCVARLICPASVENERQAFPIA